MSEHLLDNRTDERRVVNWLKKHLAPGADFSVASAYFTVNAYALLRSKLDAVRSMRFLFGEPGFLNSLDPGRSPAAFRITEGGLKLQEQILQKARARDCAEWIRDKVQVRSVRDGRLLHGKMYHVAYPGSGDEGMPGLFAGRDAALMGSSNFTLYGLGAAPGGGNVELNMVAADDRDREELRNWFDDLWKDDSFTVDVKDDVLSYLARLARDNAPEWIYFLTLWHLFRDHIERRLDGDEAPELAGWRESQVYQQLYSFQRHGAHGAIHKLLTYNGCVLADSVGLGKTFEALAAIKYFELRRDKVLVLCPKKLRENWAVYRSSVNSPLNPFPKDDFRYALLSHTDLSRERGMVGDINLATFDWSSYGLIVIDESHNFRNNTPGKRDEHGEIVRKSRYQRLIEEVIGQGVKTRVLLLSATPVNTDLRDLRNQIHLMSAGKVNEYDADKLDSAFLDDLGIPSLTSLTTLAQREFNAWADPTKSNGHREARDLLAKLPSSFFTLLDELSIARSRAHIRRFYSDDIETIGRFPDRLQPLSFSPDIDLRGLFPTYDQLHDDISNYQLSLFKPSQYVKKEYRALYETEKVRNFSQEAREGFLIGMMRVNFLKRLESSVQSFEESMRRTIEKIEELEGRIHAYKAHIEANPEYNLNGLWATADEDEDLQDAFEVSAVGYDLSHLRVDDWLKDLGKDKRQLARLLRDAQDVTPERDAKLDRLKRFIAERVSNAPLDKRERPNRKVLVFTAFADTARYLYDQLHGWVSEELGLESALVTGGGDNAATMGGSDFGSILTNFSPHSKRRALLPHFPQDREIDLLIATDCISEGQNLQDCGCVVNYDIHWNPVRLIQRFGRVDRLGSLHDSIQMVNFWPTDDLNRYINLKHRVEARMALVDLAGSNQDNILSAKGTGDDETQAREIIESDLSFRDRQLLRLRDETPDIEELDGGVSLSEFTLDDFIADLMAFLEARRGELERAPLGMFGVVPSAPDAPPGIMWCLRRRGDAPARKATERGAVARFAPYFLIYVKEDGSVVLSFNEDKRLLSTLRSLCRRRGEAWEEGCRAFDARTRQGEDMSAVVKLLESATREIAGGVRTGAARALVHGAKLDAATVKVTDALDGWDLITWLVIQPAPVSQE